MKRRVVRHWLFSVAAVLAVGGLVGLLVAASGLVSIKASSGHWALTRSFLEFSMRRSIATHSWGISAPELNEPGLALKGAGAYAINCAPCHGSPGAPYPRVAYKMTPHPPDLTETSDQWSDAELFSIVKHGIKFTGMPAWPASQRDDEVWALVAFLRALPRLDPPQYQELAYGTPAEGGTEGQAPEEGLIVGTPPHPTAVASCVRCHGADGNGRGQPRFPKLAGQRRAYLFESLQAYARGDRHSGMMEPVAYGLEEKTQRELAEYYASLPTQPNPVAPGNEAALERGEIIAHRGDPKKRLPSCVDCHGPSGHARRENYPRLSGQRADYLEQQLTLFRDKKRGGTASAHLMHHVAPHLTEQQMRDVALYFASLAPDAEGTATTALATEP